MKEYKEEMNKQDKIIRVGQASVLQHGKLNDRIYLMKLVQEDAVVVFKTIESLVARYGYSKVFCKVPAQVAPLFLSKGYILEAHISGFYSGKEDAFFISKFPKSSRQFTDYPDSQLEMLYQLMQNKIDVKSYLLSTEYTIRKLGVNDIPKIASLYEETFKSYPFPIHDPAYIAETMGRHVEYFGAFKKDELAALASAEIDFQAKNAEMTDFATHKAHAGHNLSCSLLEMMEYEMQLQGITTLYTIARATSIPMNKTFIRLHFKYAGTLINNTNIAGRIESMNVFYKHV